MINSKPIAALFGGSFDPPHAGHKAIIQKLQTFANIDKVIVMPTYLNPFKSTSLASASKRLEWCQKVFTGNKIIVSGHEASLDYPSYTIDTIQMLNNRYDLKYIVIGSDNLEKIEKWKEFEKINQSLEWIIFTRGLITEDMTAPLREFKILQLNQPISSTNIRTSYVLDGVDDEIINDVRETINQNKENNNHDNQR